MSEVPRPNHFEVATDGSEVSELLCLAVLEPTADGLIGGSSFKHSPVYSTGFKQDAVFLDETTMTIEFTARKQGVNDEGELTVLYNPSLTFSREARIGEWVPDDGLIDENDDDEDDSGAVAILVDDEGNPIIDEDEGLCFVQEVWDYFVDDEDFTVRRDVRYEYYDANGKPIDVIGQTSVGTSDLMLVEDIEADTALQIEDTAFTRELTGHDIEIIEAICTRDFNKLKETLERTGCFDVPAEFELEDGDLVIAPDDEEATE